MIQHLKILTIYAGCEPGFATNAALAGQIMALEREAAMPSVGV